MHIRIDYRNGAASGTLPIAASTTREKPKTPKCHSPHIIDADLLMQTVAEVLKKIEDYSISNRAGVFFFFFFFVSLSEKEPCHAADRPDQKAAEAYPTNHDAP